MCCASRDSIDYLAALPTAACPGSASISAPAERICGQDLRGALDVVLILLMAPCATAMIARVLSVAPAKSVTCATEKMAALLTRLEDSHHYCAHPQARTQNTCLWTQLLSEYARFLALSRLTYNPSS